MRGGMLNPTGPRSGPGHPLFADRPDERFAYWRWPGESLSQFSARVDAELKHSPIDEEELGRVVREIWIEWAREQPNPKASWLIPWDELPEELKVPDRIIGARLFILGMRAAGDETV